MATTERLNPNAQHRFSSTVSERLDHRIEVVVPVEDHRVRNELESIFKELLADNTQSWRLRSDGSWQRIEPKKSERRRSAQAMFMRRRERARRLARSH